MYKLRDWVDESRLTNGLSRNERAVEYLETHKRLIDHDNIYTNENAIHIIEKRIQYDKGGCVNCNKNAVNFLRNNRQYIDYHKLCGLGHGIEFVDELIKKNELYKIDWGRLSMNPAAMHILTNPEYYTYIDWHYILENKNAVDFVKNNLHMVMNDRNWYYICLNSHLIDILEEYIDKIRYYTNWINISMNCNAIHILEKNMNKINRTMLCMNKNGFNLLLRLNHVFEEDMYNYKMYDKNIVYEYFDYCEKNNIPFNLIQHLSKYGYTEKHMEFLKHNHNSEHI